MKMGMNLFVVVVLFGLGYVHFFANSLGGHSLKATAEDLVELAGNQRWEIDEWQILIREEQEMISDKESFKQHVHMMSRIFDNWMVKSVDVTSSEWSALITNNNPSMDTKETVKIFAYPENGQYRVSHTYQLQGSSLHTLSSQQLEPLVQSRMNSFSLDQATIFTQLKTSQNENLLANNDISHFADQLLESLDATQVEALEEDHFLSVSAYLEDWEQAIETNGEEMNIQLAIRQEQGLGSRTTVTIGTPIITTEY
ncbi:hypothetical protein BTS2_1950 [Bacillus sp. TS-2]|nr:hypothetical protein BTS2_1950 [Bacillus sp. TS-2]